MRFATGAFDDLGDDRVSVALLEPGGSWSVRGALTAARPIDGRKVAVEHADAVDRFAVVAMADGRVLNGIVKSRNDRTLTIQTQNEVLVLDQREIEGLKPTSSSLMAEGLLDTLTPVEVRDLFAYLMGRVQAPLPVESSP